MGQRASVEVSRDGSGRGVEETQASEDAKGVGAVGFVIWCAAQSAFKSLTTADPGTETGSKGFEAGFAGWRGRGKGKREREEGVDGHAAVGAADVLFAVDGHVEAARRVFYLAEPVPPVKDALLAFVIGKERRKTYMALRSIMSRPPTKAKLKVAA